MKVTELELKNYRNISELHFEPDSGINIIYGENAQGKTNILESIWIFSGMKSFRGAKDSEFIQFEKDFSKMKLGFQTERRSNKAEITVTNKRNIVLNGVKLGSPAELIGSFRSVVFSPSFLSIIQDGPSERRKFTDTAICQLKPHYAVLLQEYTRLIKQRNSLLKDVSYNSSLLDMLDIIDEKASETGEKIIAERNSYLETVREPVCRIYDGLSSGREKISFEYIRKYGTDGMTLREIFRKNRKEDIINKTTSAGPHRDDIDICINGISARLYGSQGQQRSCALALKLGEASVIKEATGEQPVALLDDVMSELDTLRQDYILNHIRDWQVFITCCEPSSVLRMCHGKTVNIEKGKIIQCT